MCRRPPAVQGRVAQVPQAWQRGPIDNGSSIILMSRWAAGRGLRRGMGFHLPTRHCALHRCRMLLPPFIFQGNPPNSSNDIAQRFLYMSGGWRDEARQRILCGSASSADHPATLGIPQTHSGGAAARGGAAAARPPPPLPLCLARAHASAAPCCGYRPCCAAACARPLGALTSSAWAWAS